MKYNIKTSTSKPRPNIFGISSWGIPLPLSCIIYTANSAPTSQSIIQRSLICVKIHIHGHITAYSVCSNLKQKNVVEEQGYYVTPCKSPCNMRFHHDSWRPLQLPAPSLFSQEQHSWPGFPECELPWQGVSKNQDIETLYLLQENDLA